MRLAKVMSMFRWASFCCAGKGSIWEIDNNKNVPSYDGGKQWDTWTAMALQCMQAQGIPVLPCVKTLGAIAHLKRDGYHFLNTIEVHHTFARIIEAQYHIALIYGTIKEIAHGCVQPWGPSPVVIDYRSGYEAIWETWPKSEGLGIPGPAQWADY